MKLENAKALDMDQMENVAGGTVAETRLLMDTILDHKKDGDVAKFFMNVLDNIPGGKLAGNCAYAYAVEKVLKDKFGIDSGCSVGWGGSGFRESHNWFKKDGKNLSMGQVIDIIKNS